LHFYHKVVIIITRVLWENSTCFAYQNGWWTLVVKFEEYNMGTNEMIFRLKKNKFFVEFFNLKTFIQLVKYGVTGLLSLFTYVFLIYILTDYFGVGNIIP
jgi:hypothetical protein